MIECSNRTLRSFLAAISSVMLLALVFTSTAYAHRPVFAEPGGVVTMDEIQISHAWYMDITTSGQVDTYIFEGQAGEHLHAGIVIPAVSGLEDFGVSMALLGPGLPPVDAAALPPNNGPGQTVSGSAGSPPDTLLMTDDLGEQPAIICPSEVNEDFYEPFTQTNYWKRQTLETDLPATGTYQLIIWNPDGRTGKYVLDVGTAEEFGVSDLFLFPVWWVKVHRFFGQTEYLAGGVLLVMALVGGLVWRRRRRRIQAL